MCNSDRPADAQRSLQSTPVMGEEDFPPNIVDRVWSDGFPEGSQCLSSSGWPFAGSVIEFDASRSTCSVTPSKRSIESTLDSSLSWGDSPSLTSSEDVKQSPFL